MCAGRGCNSDGDNRCYQKRRDAGSFVNEAESRGHRSGSSLIIAETRCPVGRSKSFGNSSKRLFPCELYYYVVVVIAVSEIAGTHGHVCFWFSTQLHVIRKATSKNRTKQSATATSKRAGTRQVLHRPLARSLVGDSNSTRHVTAGLDSLQVAALASSFPLATPQARINFSAAAAPSADTF